jgi:hypothetical protein
VSSVVVVVVDSGFWHFLAISCPTYPKFVVCDCFIGAYVIVGCKVWLVFVHGRAISGKHLCYRFAQLRSASGHDSGTSFRFGPFS